MKNDLAIFEEHQIRRVFDEETEAWLSSALKHYYALFNQYPAQKPNPLSFGWPKLVTNACKKWLTLPNP